MLSQLIGVSLAGLVALTGALDATKKLEGSYDGKGQGYALLQTGEVKPSLNWTEVVTAGDAKVEDGRAFVTVKSNMTGQGWTHEMSFIEGYFVEEDGSAGSRFFEMDGRITVETETAPGEFEFGVVIPGSYLAQENLTGMGILIPQADVEVVRVRTVKKVTINAEGREQDDVIQTTGVRFKNDKGVVVEQFFKSMVMQHLKRL